MSNYFTFQELVAARGNIIRRFSFVQVGESVRKLSLFLS